MHSLHLGERKSLRLKHQNLVTNEWEFRLHQIQHKERKMMAQKFMLQNISDVH